MIEHDAFDLRLDIEVVRHLSQALRDRAQHLRADCRRGRFGGVIRLKDRGRFAELFLAIARLRFGRFHFVERLL